MFRFLFILLSCVTAYHTKELTKKEMFNQKKSLYTCSPRLNRSITKYKIWGPANVALSMLVSRLPKGRESSRESYLGMDL